MISKLIQIIKGTDMAEGKDIPLRIPLGSDCIAELRNNQIAHIAEDLQ